MKAYIRRCAAGGAAAFVVRRGDDSAGTVLIKLNLLDGTASVLSPARNGLGEAIWLRATGPEPVEDSVAEAYIERQRGFDPDIWVVEVEDREGRHFLEDIEEE